MKRHIINGRDVLVPGAYLEVEFAVPHGGGCVGGAGTAAGTAAAAAALSFWVFVSDVNLGLHTPFNMAVMISNTGFRPGYPLSLPPTPQPASSPGKHTFITQLYTCTPNLKKNKHDR